MIQNNELWEGNVNCRRKYLDAILDTNQGIINIEINSATEDYIRTRNFAYLSRAYANHTLRGEEYDTETKFIQLNFTYNLKDTEYYRVYSIQDNMNKRYINNFTIYEYNMDKYVKLWYTNKKQEIEENKYLIMMDLEKEELEKFSREEEVVKVYMNKLNRINEDPAFLNLIDYEQDYKMMINTLKHQAIKKGHEEGFEKGIEKGIEKGRVEGIISIAKNLLKNGMNIKDVSKNTGLSIKELENYQSN